MSLDHSNDDLIKSSKYSNKPRKRVINRNLLATEYHGSCGPNVSYTFNQSTGELNIYGSGLMTDYSIEGVPWRSYRSLIKTAIIGDGITTIGTHEFRECNVLTSISIPSSVTKIFYQAFCLCTKLASVTIPYGVTSIEQDVFYSCSSLTSIIEMSDKA